MTRFHSKLIVVFPVGLALVVAWCLPLPQRVAGDGVSQSASSKKKAEQPDWKRDPVCQMVFFAVLEGLYADGVPDNVVDSLVPKGQSALKANFVAECPLCHPVYEALTLYQRRGRFQDGKESTFGPGLSDEITKRLTSKVRQQRLETLRTLVHRWVERRMKMMRLTKEEHAAWLAKLEERSQQGKQKLMTLMRKDPDYSEGWSPYWGCAACNGTLDAWTGPTRLGGHPPK